MCLDAGAVEPPRVRHLICSHQPANHHTQSKVNVTPTRAPCRSRAVTPTARFLGGGSNRSSIRKRPTIGSLQEALVRDNERAKASGNDIIIITIIIICEPKNNCSLIFRVAPDKRCASSEAPGPTHTMNE